MDLLDRYLQAVRFLLPKRQRDDVARELSEELRSQIEEKEDGLRRPLDEGELSALLKKFGHPVTLGLRYQQDRYLIGPAVFPLFSFAVQFVLGVLAIVHLLLPTVYFAVTNEPGRIVGLFVRFPGVVLPALGSIVLCFAVLETKVVWTALERAFSNWKPQDLPPLVKDERAKPPAAAGVVLSAMFSIWWLVGLHFPRLLLGPGADYIAFGPIFYRLYIPMAAAALATAGLGWLRLSRPHAARLLWGAGLMVDSLGLVILYLLSRGSEWMVAAEGLARLPGSAGLVDLANFGTLIGLNVALVVSGITFAWKYLSDTRGRPWGRRPSAPDPV